MLILFRCESDSSLWSLDTDKLRYARLSKPLTEIVDSSPVVEEFGSLILLNQLIEQYRLDGRTEKTEAPGAGLCAVTILTRLLNTGPFVGIAANVPIKEPQVVNPQIAVQCEVIGQG